MHELFISAVIPDEKLQGILMILQGLCGMLPANGFEWQLFFEGPRSQPLPTIGPQQLQQRRQANVGKFRDLSKQIQRSSYTIAACYDISGTVEPANGEQAGQDASIDFASQAGTLRFLDFPDPIGNRTYHSRLSIIIPQETQLPAFLESVQYRYMRDSIRESYVAFKDNTTIRLSRDYLRPQASEEASAQVIPSMRKPLEELTAFDPERKWLLTASVEVEDATQPDLVKRATDQLDAVKFDLTGICDFVAPSRQKLDTRLPLQR